MHKLQRPSQLNLVYLVATLLVACQTLPNTPTPQNTAFLITHPTDTVRATKPPVLESTPTEYPYPMRLDEIGQFGGSVTTVALNNNFAYLGVGPRLVIVDISDPQNPRQVGRSEWLPGLVTSVAVFGEYALASDDGGVLYVFDISDPANPTTLSSLKVSSKITDIAVVESHTYLAARDVGLVIVDLANVLSPRIISQTKYEGETAEIVVIDNIAVIANIIETSVNDSDHKTTLHILDVSDVEHIVHLSELTAGTGLIDIAAGNHFAYALFGNNEIQQIDIANPSSATSLLLDTISPADLGITATANHIYVLGEVFNRQTYILTVHNFTDKDPNVKPVPNLKFEDSVSASDRLVVRRHFAYTVDDKGLKIYDLRVQPEKYLYFPPDETIYSWSWEPIGTFRADYGTVRYACCIASFIRLHTNAGYLYTESNEDIFSWSLEDPPNLIFDPNVPLGSRNRPLGFLEETQIDSRDHLQLAHIAVPNSIAQQIDGHIDGLISDNGLFFVLAPSPPPFNHGSPSDLLIFDMGNPDSPKLIGTYSGIPYDHLMDAKVAGRYLFLYPRSDSSLKEMVIDLTDPAHPKETQSFPDYFRHREFISFGGLIYTFDEGKLVIFSHNDIDTPLSITEVDPTIDLEQSAGWLHYYVLRDDKLVAVPGNDSTSHLADLYLISVADPQHPEVLASYSSEFRSPHSVAIDGDYLYVLIGGQGIVILHLSP